MALANTGTIDLNGFDQTVKGLTNAGNVNFGPVVAEGDTFKPVTLTVNGHYVGQGGTLTLRTQLGDDDAPTDRMNVSGNVSGTTTLKVTNANGLGALTDNGILLVQVGGSSTADAFTLAGGAVDAGAFRYRLFEGTATGTDDNWYLRSQASEGTPAPSPQPPCGDECDPPVPPPCADDCEPPSPQPPAPPAPPSAPEYRPEVPWATALPSVLRQGGLDLLGTAHKRKGDELNGLDSHNSNQNRAWGRFLASDTRQNLNNVTSPEVNGQSRGLQFGVDLYQHQEHELGLYAGWLKANAEVSGKTGATPGTAWVGSLAPEITAVGSYWTYRAPSHLYLDAVVQKSWFGGNGTAATGVQTDIKGGGLLASVEVGYGFDLAKHWLLEPQAQLVQTSTHLDAQAIPNATVDYGSHSSRVGRLGLRLLGDYTLSSDKAIKPYLRANLWQGFGGDQRTSFVNAAAVTPILTQASYRSGELGAGFSMSLGSGVSLYGEIDRMFSIGGEASATRGTSGSLGLRFAW
jgi:outer membrane autotransporter protein